MTTFFRIHDTDVCKPEQLLEAKYQVSRVWVGHVERTCKECNGAGSTWEDGDPEDEDDYGRRLDCEACGGVGRIVIHSQEGVSVCRSLSDLVDYLSERSFYTAESVVLVALEGDLADDEDVDAESGAVLVHPTRIVSVGPVPQEILDLAGRDDD